MTTQAAPSLQQKPTTWDVVAPTYAEDVWQWKTYHEEALREVTLRPDHRVLDVATGPGTLALLAAPVVARVDAVDFSPGMVEQVGIYAARAGISNVTPQVMDASALAFPDATFDAAFCMFGFFFFPDRAKAFREIHRVLRPGGQIVIATWSPIERRPLMRIAFEAFAEALPQVPRPGKGELQEPAECFREMTEAGFTEVSTRLVTSSMRAESAEDYLTTIERSAAPIAVMRKMVGEDAWAGMRPTVLAALRARLPEGSADLSAEAILTRGRR